MGVSVQPPGKGVEYRNTCDEGQGSLTYKERLGTKRKKSGQRFLHSKEKTSGQELEENVSITREVTVGGNQGGSERALGVSALGGV